MGTLTPQAMAVWAGWQSRDQLVRIRQWEDLQLSRVEGFKPKDLMGLPWRIAFALQDDGWYLRSAIVWHKPNPMPESVRDRPTSAYEMIFLLTKQPRYFYDAEAIRTAARIPSDD